MSATDKVPRIALGLLGEIALLSDRVDDDGILLALLLEEVGSSDLREPEDLRKIGVLVTSKLGDVPLGDLLQRLPLLHLPRCLRSSSFSLAFLTHSGLLLLPGADPLNLLSLALPICPFALHEIHEFPGLQLLGLSRVLVRKPFLSLQELKHFAEEKLPLPRDFPLSDEAVSEVLCFEVNSWAQGHRVHDYLQETDGFQGIADVIVGL